MNLIDGRKIAIQIENGLKKSKRKGGLGVILVGTNPESHLYVKLKEGAAACAGIYFEKYLYPQDTKEKEILAKIKELNSNKKITGIIVQLPLPKHLNTGKIISAMDPEKDVDGYHPENLKEFQSGKFSFYPPVLGAVLEILKEIKLDIKEKNVALVSKSEIFPIPYHAYFEKNAKTFVRCKPQNLTKCLLADIVISAIGKKHYLKSKHIKKGAVVIDVGIVREGKKIFGDADPVSLSRKSGWLTPVPGGVGPVTVACLLKNTSK